MKIPVIKTLRHVVDILITGNAIIRNQEGNVNFVGLQPNFQIPRLFVILRILCFSSNEKGMFFLNSSSKV